MHTETVSTLYDHVAIHTETDSTLCDHVATLRLTVHCVTMLPHQPTNSALTGTHLTPGWREAIMIKCLAQGHKCHGRDSNPHSAANTRT